MSLTIDMGNRDLLQDERSLTIRSEASLQEGIKEPFVEVNFPCIRVAISICQLVSGFFFFHKISNVNKTSTCEQPFVGISYFLAATLCCFSHFNCLLGLNSNNKKLTKLLPKTENTALLCLGILSGFLIACDSTFSKSATGIFIEVVLGTSFLRYLCINTHNSIRVVYKNK